MPRRPESSLYAPVKDLFESLGFEVKGEVGSCDAVAIRGDSLVAIELKPAFNLDVVLQGIRRQTMTDNVYLAVEVPKASGRGPNARRWSDIRKLCRRLELGLVGVSFCGDRGKAEIICDPVESSIRRDKKARVRLMKEFAGRTGDYNVGGTTKRARITAYREKALKVAAYLNQKGASKPSVIKEHLALPNAYAILKRNVYGWFTAEGSSLYSLNDRGRQDLDQYGMVVVNLDIRRNFSEDEINAMRLMRHIISNGCCSPAQAKGLDIPKAESFLRQMKYGWFERVERGIYGVSKKGMDALDEGNHLWNC